MRRATLVPGFRVSWAGESHAGPPEAARRPGGQGCDRGRAPPAGSRSVGREACPCGPSQSPPGGINGLPVAVWRSPPPGNPTATQCGPGCHSASAKYRSSVQQPHGEVVLRGATGESPTEGSGLSRGGNTGGTRSSEEVRRPYEAAGRSVLRGDRRPGRRTFRSLELRLSIGSGPPRRAYLSTPDRTPTALDRKHRPCWPFGSCHGGCTAVRAPLLSIREPIHGLEQVVSNRPRVSLIPQIGHLPSTVAP